MELSDLYSDKVLEITAQIPTMPRLARPDASARRVSPVCGSVIEVDVEVSAGRISAFGQVVSACALGQASAAIVAKQIVGSTPDEMRLVRTQMHAMLKAAGPFPADAKWAELQYLAPVRDYPPRHSSTLLVFDAVVDALDVIERNSKSRLVD